MFATDDAIYVLAVQGTFQHQNDHLFLLRFPIRNGVMTRDSDKSLLIDGIHRNIQGLYRSPEGDFYFGTVTPDALAHLGGQETRGLIKIPSSEFNRDGTLILHSTETIDIEPPVGQFIENCVGTVSNTRGEASVVANAHVTDTPDNKIRITFPVDYATESEVYVTGQYQLRE